MPNKDILEELGEKAYIVFNSKSIVENAQKIFYEYQSNSPKYNIELHVKYMREYGLKKHENDKDFNKEAYIIACFFHDLARLKDYGSENPFEVQKREPRNIHKEEGVNIFRKKFEKEKISKETKKLIEICILEHSDKRITKEDFPELLTIREADRISLLRIFAKNAKKQGNLWMVDAFNAQKKDLYDNVELSDYAKNMISQLDKKIKIECGGRDLNPRKD